MDYSIIMLLHGYVCIFCVRSITQHSSVTGSDGSLCRLLVCEPAAILCCFRFPIGGNIRWKRESRDYVFAIILGLVFAKLIATVFFSW